MSTDLRLRTARGVLAAIAVWASVAAAGQPDPKVLQQQAAEGERALAEGRYSDAEQAYEQLRSLSPSTPEVHARLGLIYFQQGKFTEAVDPLRQALKLKPDLPKIDTLLAMSLSELGKYKEALPGLKKGFSQTTDAVLRRMAGLHLQRAYHGLGQDREAVEVALTLARLHPEDPEVLYHSSRLFANFAYLQTMKLASIAPDSVWMHQAAGEANESQGLYDAALREYKQVLALAPRRPGIHFRIGRVLLARSNDRASAEAAADARAAFEEELQIDPTNANAAYELAEMHRKSGELRKARELFERAIGHDPGFENALVGLGRTLIALGEAEKALSYLEDAAKRRPEDAVTWYQLAQAYRALGRTAEQEQALAEFARTRTAADRRSGIPEPPGETTPQKLDAQRLR